MEKTSEPDFEILVEENKNYYDFLWDYCCCIGCHPADIMFPGMKSHVAKHTFNMIVYESARQDQVEQQMKMSSMGMIGRMMRS